MTLDPTEEDLCELDAEDGSRETDRMFHVSLLLQNLQDAAREKEGSRLNR